MERILPVIGGPQHGQLFNHATGHFQLVDPMRLGDHVFLKDDLNRATTPAQYSNYFVRNFEYRFGASLVLIGECFVHESVDPKQVHNIALSLLIAHQMVPTTGDPQ